MGRNLVRGGARNRPDVQAGLAKNTGSPLHFTPMPGSWLNRQRSSFDHRLAGVFLGHSRGHAMAASFGERPHRRRAKPRRKSGMRT